VLQLPNLGFGEAQVGQRGHVMDLLFGDLHASALVRADL
jgi:hypothetical protein